MWIATGRLFTTAGVCELNRALLAGTRIADAGGALRKSQDWIGGNRVNPVGVAYVPPEPDLVPKFMEDLVEFPNGTELPPVAAAVLALEEAGILHQNAKNRKSGIYVAHEVVDAFNAYERSLATPSGDTSLEKPVRHVPQRGCKGLQRG